MDLSMATCNAEKAAMKSTEYRKVIKPLLERRRRARINSCLDELKAIILENAQNENTDASKLEKADILELTVQHLRSLRRQSRHWGPSATPTLKTVEGGVSSDKFRAGFAECAHEVSSYISSLDCVDSDVRCRLLTHLGNCVNRMPCLMPAAATPPHHMPTYVSPNGGPINGPTGTPCLDSLCTSMPLCTPTPPQSPVSPLQACGTPTTCHPTQIPPPTMKTDYVVPVSPVSPPAEAPTSPYAASRYGANYVTVRSDVYVWPDMVSCKSGSSNRSSPMMDTRSYGGDDYYYYDRLSVAPESPQSCPKEVTVDIDRYASSKPWRPW